MSYKLANKLTKKNFVIDFFISGLFVSLWFFIVISFEIHFSFAYLLVFGIFILWFGYKHYVRQIFISILFLVAMIIINHYFNIYEKFFIGHYTVFFLFLSFLSYIYTKKDRDIHRKLNEEFLVLKDNYNKVSKEKILITDKIKLYNQNIDTVLNIYNISRKMIISVNSEEILNLIKGFLNKVFYDNDYFIFRYDLDNHYFSMKYNNNNITEEVLFKFRIKFKKYFLNKVIENNKLFLFDKNSENLAIFKEIFGNNTEAIIFMPLINKKEFIQLAIIIFRSKDYLNMINFEYLDIFSKQISLGLHKIEVYEEVQEKLITDNLTGLYRRSFFSEKFEYELKRAKRDKFLFSVLLIDLDYFKLYNDKYGHLVGDEILTKVSRELKDCVYDTDIIARYGGEEFIVLLPMVDRSQAFSTAEKIRTKIESTKFFDLDKVSLNWDFNLNKGNITISIGLVCFPDDGETQEILIEKADKALYYAKENGRNRVVDYFEMKKIFL